jgi:hypothetical protein
LHNKQKLKEFMTSIPAMQKIFKCFLHREEETRISHENARKKKNPLTKQTSKTRNRGKVNIRGINY